MLAAGARPFGGNHEGHAEHGADRRGDELPAWVADTQNNRIAVQVCAVVQAINGLIFQRTPAARRRTRAAALAGALLAGSVACSDGGNDGRGFFSFARREAPAEAFSAHTYFMTNPSLSGRGQSLEGKKVPKLKLDQGG